MEFLKRELKDYKVLLRSVPSMVTAIFILSVVCMNLLANKELYNSKYLCLDCGLALSWVSFLCMDCICKRFGAKASIKISILALSVNVITVLIFKLLTMTPGHWAAYYSASDPATAELINDGLNATFGGAWYVVLGSATAMLVSSIVNSISNVVIGRIADNGSYRGFATRSFISTAIGQFVDNLVFSSLVSHVFFGWTWPQVLLCAFTNMLLELLAEAIFSPIGYKVSKDWESDGVGEGYLNTL
ncbi:MAG: VUT family protein [Lachnospiraceae bacterium]|nr:VUT family protein [Lachnospiraceae bacterium]